MSQKEYVGCINPGLNLEGFINKADLGYAFNKDNITFPKTGADIKTMLNEKKTTLSAKLPMATAKMSVIAQELKEAGYEPKTSLRNGMDTSYFEEAYRIKSDGATAQDKEIGKLMCQYNDLAYEVNGLQSAIQEVDLLNSSLADKTTYKLTFNQLSSLNKGTDAEVIEKAEDGAKKKVEKVMTEFKEGKLKSAGKVVTDKKQAIAIAMSEAGLSKEESGADLYKFFPTEYKSYFKDTKEDKTDKGKKDDVKKGIEVIDETQIRKPDHTVSPMVRKSITDSQGNVHKVWVAVAPKQS